MDDLRWILLGVGIVIVVAVYFWSRSRKQDGFYTSTPPVDDLPSFAAEDKDGWVDGVSPVRVVARQDDIQVEPAPLERDDADALTEEPVSEAKTETITETETPEVVEENQAATEEPAEKTEKETQAEPEKVESAAEEEQEASPQTDAPATSENDVISLFLIVREQKPLKGESILSAALANHLEYGEMKIFHRKDDNGEIIFSMANMLEPGYFDPDTMQSMETRGVSFFIQLGLCDDPVKALDDMLICAHAMANMLGTHLCDQNRQILDEVSTRSMREKAKRFIKA